MSQSEKMADQYPHLLKGRQTTWTVDQSLYIENTKLARSSLPLQQPIDTASVCVLFLLFSAPPDRYYRNFLLCFNQSKLLGMRFHLYKSRKSLISGACESVSNVYTVFVRLGLIARYLNISGHFLRF